MKRHLFGLQSKDFGDGGLIDGLKLRASPYFCLIAIEPHGGIKRFHWGVSQVRKLIFSDDAVGCGDAVNRFCVAAGDRTHARSASEFFVSRAELRSVRTLDALEIPVNLQAVARLFRRPKLICHNGNAGAFGERNLEYIPYPFDTACRSVVKAF